LTFATVCTLPVYLWIFFGSRTNGIYGISSFLEGMTSSGDDHVTGRNRHQRTGRSAYRPNDLYGNRAAVAYYYVLDAGKFGRSDVGKCGRRHALYHTTGVRHAVFRKGAERFCAWGSTGRPLGYADR